MRIGIAGAGVMGSGIAQIAAQNGYKVVLYDNSPLAIKKAKKAHEKVLARLTEKGKLKEEESREIINQIHYSNSPNHFRNCNLIIEAIIENLETKKKLFKELSEIAREDCILASNTSSLSISSIGCSAKNAGRIIGIHFFNPVPLMPLVEIIPSITTSSKVTLKARKWIDSWGKVTVLAKDTPGFIVNRIARPFYGEAIRIYEEGLADPSTIDWAMTELGGFRMGPFTLMDFIGHDVNYNVTETIFRRFYYDPRYKPNFTQKRLMEAGWLGRRTGRGFYDYSKGTKKLEPSKDRELGENILWRILVMLINEAADALHLKVATKEDIDLAMTKGVNYPKGLLRWADEKGIAYCVETLDRLHNEYLEDRYRCSPLLRKMAREEKRFY